MPTIVAVRCNADLTLPFFSCRLTVVFNLALSVPAVLSAESQPVSGDDQFSHSCTENADREHYSVVSRFCATYIL